MQVFCPILILGLVTLPVPVRIVGVPNREKKQEIKKIQDLYFKQELIQIEILDRIFPT